MPARKKQPAETPAPPAKRSPRKKADAASAESTPPKTRKPRARTAGALTEGSAGGPDLVIVESPTKAKTINKYLGSGFRVLASMGHVRDLPKGRKRENEIVRGVTRDWQASYVVDDDRKKRTLEELRKEAARCQRVFLATDPDREGEAIAWHLAEVLKLADARTFRITFNEITRTAVQTALAHAGKINMDRVRAQEARRVLDRVVGFPLSGLLNKKVKPNSSAGRVQSVALKLVVDREREIEAFETQEYWKLTALLAPTGQTGLTRKPFAVTLAKSRKVETSESGEEKPAPAPELPEGTFLAELAEWAGEKFELGAKAASNQEHVTAIATLLDRSTYRVTSIEQKDRQERAPAPFTTSTLQQQASTRLRFAGERTMKVAQQLYEGVQLGAEGQVALITYMRTDSTRISAEAMSAVRGHIGSVYGSAYVPEKPNFFASGKSAQEAHEAIRPTDLSFTPERAASLGLHGDQLRLYTLIYNRFVASQMSAAVFAVTNVTILATPEGADAPTGLFKAQGRVLKFDGFRRVLSPSGKQEDATLPLLQLQQALDRLELTASQHFTQPPPRFNESSLIKALEKEGIGRPSTYVPIVKKITDEARGYIEVKERRFHATEIGKRVTDLLVDYFPKIMDLKFTSHMEEELDDIENGKMKYSEVLDEFWAPFSEALQKAEQHMPGKHNVETGENCPDCGRPLVIKYARKGAREFIGCSGYKEGCKYIKPREGEEERPRPVETEHKCPSCAKAMIQFTGKTGVFLRCSGYPDCQTKMNYDAEGKPVVTAQATQYSCDKCRSPMVLREGRQGPFLGCTAYPKCRNIKEVDAKGQPVQPVNLGINCEKCNSPMIIRKGPRGPFLGCSGYPKCRSTKQLTEELREKLKDQLPPPAEKKQLPEVEITETCPECGSAMKLRERRFRGGGYFLGCSKYPKCKGTREAPPELVERLQEPSAK